MAQFPVYIYDELSENGVCQFASNRWFYGLPIVILSLTIANVVIFYLVPSLVYEWAIHLPPRREEGWHLLSSILVHFDAVHLFSNMFVQVLIGGVLEFYQGPLRVFSIYVCAGAVGGAFEALLTTRVPIYIAGASGAIYGLLGAFGADLFFNWNEWSCPCGWLLVYICYFAFDVVNALATDSTGIALWAHYTGALSGLVFALAVARNIRVERYESIVRLLAIVFDTLLLGGILLYTLLSWHG